MNRKFIVLSLVILILSIYPLFTVEQKDFEKYRSKGNETGYALLDDLIGAFQNMAKAGVGGYEAVNGGIQELMSRLQNAKNTKKIDNVFFHRYKRILVILKLVIIDRDYDREFILGDLIQEKVVRFLLDVQGVSRDMSGSNKKGFGIGMIAGAIADELLNLHQYLDGMKYREDLLKSYQQRILGKKK